MLIVAGIIGLLAWRRRRSRSAATRLDLDKSTDAAMECEQSCEEMPGTEVYEISGHVKPHEADGNSYRAELPADWQGWEMSTPVGHETDSVDSAKAERPES